MFNAPPVYFCPSYTAPYYNQSWLDQFQAYYYPFSGNIIPNQLGEECSQGSHRSRNNPSFNQQPQRNQKSSTKEKQTENIDVNSSEIIRIQNRNILPNKVNLILSFIRRVNKSGKLVERIIQRHNNQKHSFSTKRFFAYQLYLKENLTDFLNKNAVSVIINHIDSHCCLFSLLEQQFYNKVCRILISCYIRQTCMLDVLGCFKIKKSKRSDHLKVQRFLEDILKGQNSIQKCLTYKM